MKNTEFIELLISVANNYKTVYANGMFGQLLTKSVLAQKANQLPGWYNKNNNKEKLSALVGKGYFGFDCVCLIKGLLWGWNGDSTKTNGGAIYCSNGVPDISEDQMIARCSNVSTDFSKIEKGCVVWNKGHIGVYIGNGLVVECTPKWKNKVQITACANLGAKSGYNLRAWTKHGKLPYIEYDKADTPTTSKKIVKVELLTLRKGDKGNEQIKTVQRILKSLGYYKNLIDGSFGGGTAEAVEYFQAENGLTVDGVVGGNTWNALLKG